MIIYPNRISLLSLSAYTEQRGTIVLKTQSMSGILLFPFYAWPVPVIVFYCHIVLNKKCNAFVFGRILTIAVCVPIILRYIL